MGRQEILRSIKAPAISIPPARLESARRTRPRAYAEWKALFRWRQLPSWESSAPGYLMRLAREEAGLTQVALSRKLGCTQQAVAQAERWISNPTVSFLRKWSMACGKDLEIGFRKSG
jgi:DNA-binding XRE family transcriptional regulator